MTNTPRTTVCFDLGGVLARIRRTWQECLAVTSVWSKLQDEEAKDLPDFPLFDVFQLGTLSPAKYLKELAGYLAVSSADALKVHCAILSRPYEGTHRLVRDLREAGIRTACLSNTNSLHWEILDSPTFAAIKELDVKVVSQEVQLLKPDPKLLELFDQRAETSPKDVIFFDDHKGNVSAARLHGWNAHLIDPEGNPAQQIRDLLSQLQVL